MRPTAFSMVPTLVAATVLSGAGIAMSGYISKEQIFLQKKEINAPDDRKVHSLPKTYPTWTMVAQNNETSQEAIAELGTRNFLTCTFERTGAPEGEPAHRVEVHVAYYTGMIDTVPHVPERCLVAAGLQQLGTATVVPVPLDMDRLAPNPDADPELMGGTVWAGRSPNIHRRINLPLGVENLQLRVTPFRDNAGRIFHSGYFFVTNGQAVSSSNEIRLRAFRLTDDYAYYTKVQFTSIEAESPEHLGRIAASLLDEILPDLMHRMPDWVEVKSGRYPPPPKPAPTAPST
jgi:hypothetical protein